MSRNDVAYGYSQFGFCKPVQLVSREPLLPGDEGVDQTVARMLAMVLETRAVPFWKHLAVQLVFTGQGMVGEAAYLQLLRGLSGTYRYIHDSAGTEQLWEPAVHQDRIENLGHTWGDCDDAAVYAAAVAVQLDLGPLRFRAIANGKRGTELNHIFAEVGIDGVWRTLDFLSPNQPVVREKTWNISGG